MVLPPVKRGDVPRVINGAAPGVLVIVDGYFHLENLSVGHMEIRIAMSQGWQVFGVSSMGAIRACELSHLGMKGYGEVFERYAADPTFRDDEVGLLHEPNPPYREGSEPLFHMRKGLAALVTEGTLSAEAADRIVAHLMTLWFGDRTLFLLRDLVVAEVPGKEERVRAWIKDFDPHRSKAHDLIRFLEEKPWTRA